MFFLARRFVAGTEMTEAIAAVERLTASGFYTTVDILGEDVTAPDQAERAVASYDKLLETMSLRRLQPNVSLKLSSLGLAIDEKLAKENLFRILGVAARYSDAFVRIDMEGSRTVDAALHIFKVAFEAGFAIGPVLQAYLHRTWTDVEEAIRIGARVRLCKGAYNEPSRIAFRRRRDVRHAYLECARRLLLSGNYPAFATHDAVVIAAIKKLAEETNRGFDTFEFQMLYGVRCSLQDALLREGYRVRIYVPFGTHWQPYLQRRIMERRENVIFAISALFSK